MGVERNGVVVGKAFDEDVEEEEIGFGGGEEEVLCVAHGMEVEELVGELGDGCEFILKAVDDDLGVGLGEMAEGGGSLEEAEKEVRIPRRRASANHLGNIDFFS
ncbi:hypothetical protein SLE2022_151810 [Rubroshorea leprosula]